MDRPIISYGLDERELPDAAGSYVSFWIEDLVYAAEFWMVRAARIGLDAFNWALRRPLMILAAGGIGLAGLSAANAALTCRDCNVFLARMEAGRLADAAEQFRHEHGAAPNRIEDLVPRYAHATQSDPWGRSYVFLRGPGGLAVVSAGRDGLLGTQDDIVVVRK